MRLWRVRLWRVLQVLFIGAVLWYAVRLLAGQWTELAALSADLRPNWWRVAFSALIVFVSYGVLIATWRSMVVAWGERLRVDDAMRIWFVSNLGRYIPGKVWQIGAMGAMAQRVGVSPVAAAGSSVVIALINVLAGFAVVGVTGAGLVSTVLPTTAALLIGLVVGAVAVIALPWLLPPLTRFALRATGRQPDAGVVALPLRAVLIAALGCAVAWVLYGLAFRELSVAILGGASGDAATYVAVFTLSYLLGFIVLLAPGGLVVREVSMATLLVAAGISAGAEAAVLVIASRLWLTVLEIVPGLLFLAFARPLSGSNSETKIVLP